MLEEGSLSHVNRELFKILKGEFDFPPKPKEKAKPEEEDDQPIEEEEVTSSVSSPKTKAQYDFSETFEDFDIFGDFPEIFSEDNYDVTAEYLAKEMKRRNYY